MDLFLLLSVVLIGVLEGLTEFLPVSSTGHLIVLKEALGVDLPEAFLIAIQLGAILAVCTVYWRRLADTTVGVLKGEAKAWHFAINLLVAFLPAVVVGLLAYDFIKSVLLESPATVGTTLVLGGIAILVLEKRLTRPWVHSVDGMGWRTALSG